MQFFGFFFFFFECKKHEVFKNSKMDEMITINLYCRFSYAGTWELVNLFVGTKILAAIFVMRTGRKHNKIL